jgi:hypothetical protein
LRLNWKEFEFDEKRAADSVVMEELNPTIETIVNLAEIVEGNFSRSKSGVKEDVFVINIETKNGSREADIVESEVVVPTWVGGLVLADIGLFDLIADGNFAIGIGFIEYFLFVLELSRNWSNAEVSG